MLIDTQDPDTDTEQATVQPGDVNLWTTEHVKLWLIKEGFEEEVGKFEGMSHICENMVYSFTVILHMLARTDDHM